MDFVKNLSDAELRSELAAYSNSSVPVVNKFTRPALQKKLVKLIEADGGRQDVQNDDEMEVDGPDSIDKSIDESIDESIDDSINEPEFTQVQDQHVRTPYTPVAVTTRVNTATSPGIPRAPHLDTSAEVLRRRQLRSANLSTRSVARRPQAEIPQKQEAIIKKRSIGWKSIIAFVILLLGCVVIYKNMESSNISLKTGI